MSGGIREGHGIVIKSTKTGDASKLSPTPAAATPTPASAADALDAFEKRVSETYWRLMRVFEESGEFVDVDLNRELAPRLWRAILHDGLDGYAGTPDDLEAALRGRSKLRLIWPLDNDDENRTWTVITSDGVPIARGEFEHFHDESRWNVVALRWLATQLGTAEQVGVTVRKALHRK